MHSVAPGPIDVVALMLAGPDTGPRGVHRPAIAAERRRRGRGWQSSRGTRRRPGMWYAAVPICNLVAEAVGSSWNGPNCRGTARFARTRRSCPAALGCTLMHALKLLEFKTLGPLAYLRDWVCALSRHLPCQVRVQASHVSCTSLVRHHGDSATASDIRPGY
jgi:hypothetical protein